MFCIFANLFNIGLNRGPLDSHTCFCVRSVVITCIVWPLKTGYPPGRMKVKGKCCLVNFMKVVLPMTAPSCLLSCLLPQGLCMGCAFSDPWVAGCLPRIAQASVCMPPPREAFPDHPWESYSLPSAPLAWSICSGALGSFLADVSVYLADVSVYLAMVLLPRGECHFHGALLCPAHGWTSAPSACLHSPVVE